MLAQPTPVPARRWSQHSNALLVRLLSDWLHNVALVVRKVGVLVLHWLHAASVAPRMSGLRLEFLRLWQQHLELLLRKEFSLRHKKPIAALQNMSRLWVQPCALTFLSPMCCTGRQLPQSYCTIVNLITQLFACGPQSSGPAPHGMFNLLAA